MYGGVTRKWNQGVAQRRAGMTDGLVARQTDVERDGRFMRQTYRRSGGVGEARWGCKATYSLLMVGGPLDRCRRGLGRVESRRCNCAARKSSLGVSRRS